MGIEEEEEGVSEEWPAAEADMVKRFTLWKLVSGGGEWTMGLIRDRRNVPRYYKS
jgi:hypothetical protein